MHDFGWHAVPPVPVSCRCHSCLPVAWSKHSTCSRSSRVPELHVTYTFPPATTGDDTPRAGSAAFHLIPLPSLPHSSGRFFSSDTPEPFGPLNCGQSPARSVSASASVSEKPAMKRLTSSPP